MSDRHYVVLVRPGGQDHFTAQAIAFPELRAEAPTEEEAVEKVRDSLLAFLATSKLVQVSVEANNPWLDLFGHSANDPHFDEYVEEIRQARSSEAEE